MARRRRTQPFVLLTGVRQLDAQLIAVGPKVGNPAARSGLTKGVRLAVKLMKRETAQKSVKKALGGNVKRRGRGKDKGRITAKAGAGVGKKAKTAGVRGRNPSGGPGVGIGFRNVHWYILGTGEREQQTTGRSTGAMPAHDLVARAMAGGRRQVLQAITTGTRQALQREIRKRAVRTLGVR